MDQPTCSCDYQDTAYIARSCGSSINVTLFMTLVDVMLRTQCDLADPCGRASSNKVRNMSLLDEYDFIVVGGGVAGPVVAGRLSENKQWSVLLLEAGPDEPTVTSVPGFAASAVGTHLDWKYKTEKNKNACLITGGICKWPRGKMLAGTGAMTGMMYTRSHPSIYDEWQRQGNTGWGFSDVLKYFIKSENNLNPELVEKDYHGFSGPLKVQKFNFRPPIGEDIVKAGRELGYSNTDFNGANQIGVDFAQVMVDNGVRSSTPRMFLRDKYEQGNIKVQLNAHVMKVNIDPSTKRAESVTFKDMNTNQIKTVRARKEIILTAGAIGSPQLLMLSGVGPKNNLDQLGINTIADLRVGYNLVHHVGVNLKYTIKDNDLRSLDFENLNNYISYRNGTLASTGLTQLTGFFKSKYNNIRDLQVFFDGYTTDCSYTGYNEECNSGQLMTPKKTKLKDFLSNVKMRYKNVNQENIVESIVRYFENFISRKFRQEKNVNVHDEFDKFLNILIKFDENDKINRNSRAINNNDKKYTHLAKIIEELGGVTEVEIDKSLSIPMENLNAHMGYSTESLNSLGVFQKEGVPNKFQTGERQMDIKSAAMNSEIFSLLKNIDDFVEYSENERVGGTAIPHNVNQKLYFPYEKEEIDLVSYRGPGDDQDEYDRHGKSIVGSAFSQLFSGQTQTTSMPCGRRSIYARPTNLLPISRGRLVLNSSDPFDYPKIYSNYFARKEDINVLVDGIRIVQRLTKAQALKNWDFQLDRTHIPECSQYKWDSNEYWECYIRIYTLPENHPGGTCKMGPANDIHSVVDPELRVLGIKNLRVMDASVFPTNINSNPIATIIMIAEKGADFLKDTWR